MTTPDDARSDYFKLSDDYSRLYNQYLNQKFSSDTKDQTQAQKTYNELQQVDKKLKEALRSTLSSDVNASKVLDASTNIEKKTFQIYDKAKTLDLQQDIIQRKNEELHSKKRQIEMGVQKNKYRRNLILFLLALNALILVSIYYFYKKTG